MIQDEKNMKKDEKEEKKMKNDDETLEKYERRCKRGKEDKNR